MNRGMRRITVLGLTICYMAVATGCSFFAPWDQTLHIACEQKGVKIEVDGAPQACPADVTVRRNKAVDILARKDGYPTQQRTIRPQISNVGIVDMIGGFIILVPFIGMASPGAFELETDRVVIDMTRPPLAPSP